MEANRPSSAMATYHSTEHRAFRKGLRNTVGRHRNTQVLTEAPYHWVKRHAQLTTDGEGRHGIAQPEAAVEFPDLVVQQAVVREGVGEHLPAQSSRKRTIRALSVPLPSE